MSLDPRLSVPSERVSAIENELPSYRAISALAITSLIFGILAILCFADIWFLVCGALAIVFGVLAERKIRRYPDLLTGRGLAQAGIALGLVFSLSATTVSVTQSLKIRQSASQFSRQYARLLAQGDLAHAVWYRIPPDMRRKQTAEEFFDELSKQAARDPMAGEMYLTAIQRIQKLVQEQGWSVRLLDIEQYGYDRLTPYAFACFEIRSPAGAKEARPEYAMLDLRADEHAWALDWYISELSYPYTPRSHQLKIKIDDGHGHTH